MENHQTKNEIIFPSFSSSSLINFENTNNQENDQSKEKPKKKILTKMDIIYQTFFELYSQHQFKKIVKTMKLKSDIIGKFFLKEWKLLHLRTVTLQKILDNKIAKYYNSNKNPHFSNYIKDVNKDINNWITLTKELNFENNEKYIGVFIEFIISFILKNCLILAKKFIHSGYIKDAITTLSLGVRLINNNILYFYSPDSYFLAGEIFLFFSSLMIAQKNYKTAMNLISLSIKFSYISLELKLSKNTNNYQKLFDLNKYEQEIKNIAKIFLNLSIAFYHLSVCHEKRKDSYNSYFAIKTSNFFAEFACSENLEVYQKLIIKIETRLLMRNRIIIFFDKYVRKEELEDKFNRPKYKIKSMISHEEKQQKKFLKLENYLRKIKIVEVDDDEPDLFNRVGDKQMKPNVLKMTRQMQLLNYLMKDEFKDTVNSMKKIEINKIDKETINKISKRIIHLKNKEHFKLEKNLKKQFSIRKKIEEKTNVTIHEQNDKDDSNEKMYRSQIQNKNTNHMNKSNTLKSTTLLSSSTTMNKKAQRVRSAFNKMRQNNIIQEISRKNNSKILTFRNSSKKISFTNTNISMYSTPSRYLSIHENNISNNYINSKYHIINNKILYHSNSVSNLKLNSNLIDKPTTKTIKKKNVFKLSNKVTTPRYDHDKLFLSKNFRKKYSFLENQFDKEISFHKNLLQTKYIKEDLVKPKAPNLRELNEKAKRFFYSIYYNELMNAQDKQIIFDKKGNRKKSKQKTMRRYENSGTKSYSRLNLSNNMFLDTEEINETNNNYISKMRKKILEINDKKEYLKKMKGKFY